MGSSTGGRMSTSTTSSTGTTKRIAAGERRAFDQHYRAAGQLDMVPAPDLRLVSMMRLSIAGVLEHARVLDDGRLIVGLGWCETRLGQHFDALRQAELAVVTGSC